MHPTPDCLRSGHLQRNWASHSMIHLPDSVRKIGLPYRHIGQFPSLAARVASPPGDSGLSVTDAGRGEPRRSLLSHTRTSPTRRRLISLSSEFSRYASLSAVICCFCRLRGPAPKRKPRGRHRDPDRDATASGEPAATCGCLFRLL